MKKTCLKFFVIFLFFLSFTFLLKCKKMVDVQNAPPNIDISNGFGSEQLTFVPGKNYKFEFTIKDPDGDKVSVTTHVDEQYGRIKEFQLVSDGLYRAFYIPNVKGKHEIKIVATDKKATSTAILVGDFFFNNPPVAVLKHKRLNEQVLTPPFIYQLDPTASMDSDGRITNFKWNINNERNIDTTNIVITHNFNSNGIYKIILTVMDEHGASSKDSAIIDNALLKLDIGANNLKDDFPLTVIFNAKVRDNKHGQVHYQWDFKDGKTSGLQNPSHIFENPGVYPVVCKARNDLGTVEKSITIEAIDSKPSARFSMGKLNNWYNGDRILFDATKSKDPNGDLKQYYWSLRMPGHQVKSIGNSSLSTFHFDIKAEVGRNEIGLVVEDLTKNKSDPFWISFTVENKVPTADFRYSISPRAVTIDSNLSEDSDPYDQLSYQWFVDNVEDIDAFNVSRPVLTVEPGSRVIRLRSSDKNGGFSEKEYTVKVPFHLRAVLKADSVTDNSKGIVLDGSASTSNDPNDPIRLYEFYREDPGYGFLPIGNSRSSKLHYKKITPLGKHKFGLVVNRANQVSDTSIVSVFYVNAHPVAKFKSTITCKSNPKTFRSTYDIKIDKNESEDPDFGQSISYKWYFVSVTAFGAEKKLLSTTEVFHIVGYTVPSVTVEHYLHLVVTDSEGASTLAKKKLPCSGIIIW